MKRLLTLIFVILSILLLLWYFRIHKNTCNAWYNIDSEYTGNSYVIDKFENGTIAKDSPAIVLYILDGDSFLSQFRSYLKAKYPDQPLILISIAYKGINYREKDFTAPPQKPTSFHGYAHKYVNFINEELIPQVESHLDIVVEKRVFFGHSLGGFLGLYYLMECNNDTKFTDFILASPSVWWADDYLFSKVNDWNSSLLNKEVNIFTSTSNFDDSRIVSKFDAFWGKFTMKTSININLHILHLKDLKHSETGFETYKKALKSIIQ